ncbi:MAG: hypothetical protein K1W06_02475 [Lachnospiraceae bacterium]
MDKLQQEIRDFHEELKPILEKVLKQYSNKTTEKVYKNITRPCKELIQKCSFKSSWDTRKLCSLAYWLYIYGHKKLALDICRTAHGRDFEFDDCYRSIYNIYGLEIRISRELFCENQGENLPSGLLDYCFSKKVQKEMKYPQILREEEIAACSKDFIDTELFHALYNMIGKAGTGLYPELDRYGAGIEYAIKEYKDILKDE